MIREIKFVFRNHVAPVLFRVLPDFDATDPERVVVAISIGDDDDSTAHWWGGNAGAAALHGELSRQLRPLGLTPLVNARNPIEQRVNEFALLAGDEPEHCVNPEVLK